MTRGTLFYYKSEEKVYSSVEFNGDMYHGTSKNPEGIGDDVIKLMQRLNSVNDFRTVLRAINKHYNYDEGNEYYSVNSEAIEKDIQDVIKWVDTERSDLKGTDEDPRTWDKKPTFKDVTTWKFWGVPNLSDYSYIYNNSGEDLVINTKNGEMIISNGCLGVLNYGRKDCICKNGKIINGMGNYEEDVADIYEGGGIMVKENGMVMISEKEYDALKKQINNLRRLLFSVMKKKSAECKGDIEVSRSDFIEIYENAVDDMFDKMDTDDDEIYGNNVTVHWNGIFCDCEDGATVYNNLIPAVKEIDEEIGY